MGKYVLTLTLGAKRHRLVIGDRQRVIHAEGVNPLLKAAVLGAQIDRARKNDAVNRDLVGQWLAILQPLISTAS